ncbi:Putative zn(2)-C6 fungal-type DNA-binding domain-containing protein [Septoria linicola]|uniref:Zn(2)-C6 fungal-type DNA-binding domain-containing protein n=1 Tax=Septoria linicola TaxID=215465 RepID=A0A9Q9AJE4_9PEZI|nr:Putative zn(2)-C6 fungal-type DNA-binding domain-containing protein [Septoria linicola]
MSSAQKRKRSDVQDGAEDHQTKRLSAACTQCRKQKIKCEIKNDQLPCSRCHRRGLSCVLHAAQRQSVADHRQTRLLSQDLVHIHSTIQQICDHLQLQPPQALISRGDEVSRADAVDNAESEEDNACGLSPPASPSVAQAPIDTYLTSANRVSTPNGESPARPRRRDSDRLDLVSKGIVTQEAAERLVELYLRRFDRFLYGIASQYRDFEQVRQASPTLLAAMCAVSALHDSTYGDVFEACNKEFRALISAALFEKRDLEHIRALCIASFWLPDASRILISDAARRAADCRLHRHFVRLTQYAKIEGAITARFSDQQDARDKIRLWYLLYVCDQHLAILHNRDSILSSEKDAIEKREHFLGDAPAPNDDVRLMSQVSLLVIMSQIKLTFGSEQSKPLLRSSSVQLMHFARELDQWFADWSPRFEHDHHIGGFPIAGLTMHFQFARLYLAHHVFRGLKSEPIPQHFMTAANAARGAAVTIFKMVVENEDFQHNIVGMPHYFHIMISFAAQFLIELCTKYYEQLGVEAQDDLHKVSAALALFARTTTRPQHPIARVTTGLMRKLNKCTEKLGIASVLTASPFDASDYATVGDTTTDRFDLFRPDSSVDLDIIGRLPNDFMFADFADFSFAGSNLGYTG